MDPLRPPGDSMTIRRSERTPPRVKVEPESEETELIVSSRVECDWEGGFGRSTPTPGSRVSLVPPPVKGGFRTCQWEFVGLSQRSSRDKVEWELDPVSDKDPCYWSLRLGSDRGLTGDRNWCPTETMTYVCVRLKSVSR